MEKPEIKTPQQPPEPKPGACRFCGFITPFNPKAPGYCCPFCGAPTGK